MVSTKENYFRLNPHAADSVYCEVTASEEQKCLSQRSVHSNTVNIFIVPIPLVSVCCDDTVSLGDTIKLDAYVQPDQSQEPLTVRWSPARDVDNPLAVHTFITPSYTQTLTMVVTNRYGCISDTAKVHAVVNGCPRIQSQVQEIGACQEDSLDLSIYLVGSKLDACKYTWQVSYANGLPGTWRNLTDDSTQYHNHKDTLRIQSLQAYMDKDLGTRYRAVVDMPLSVASCPSLYSSPMRINVQELSHPTLSVEPSEVISCKGNRVTLTAHVQGLPAEEAELTWYRNREAFAVNLPSYTTNTLNDTDTLSVILTSSSACIANKTREQQLVLYIADSIQMRCSGDTTILPGTQAKLEVLSVSGGQSKHKPSSFKQEPIWNFSWLDEKYVTHPNAQSTTTKALDETQIIQIHTTTKYGCESVQDIVVSVEGPCLTKLRIQASDTISCETTPVKLTALATGGSMHNSYTWTSVPLDPSVMGLNNQREITVYPFTPNTTYYVTVTDSFPAANCPLHSLTDSILLQVNARDSLRAVLTGTDTICEGEPATYSVHTYSYSQDYQNANLRYNWFLHRGFHIYPQGQGFANRTFTNLQIGDQISCQVINLDSCVLGTTDTLHTNIFKTQINISPEKLSMDQIFPYGTYTCGSDTSAIELEIKLHNEQQGMRYSIDSGKHWQKQNIFKPVKQGEYDIAVKNAFGCMSRYNQIIRVEVVRGTLIDPIVSGDTLYCDDVNMLPLQAIPQTRGIIVWYSDTTNFANEDGNGKELAYDKTSYQIPRPLPVGVSTFFAVEQVYNCKSRPMPINITISKLSPWVEVECADTLVCLGSTVQAKAQIKYGDVIDPTYQWYLNDSALQGATSPDSAQFQVQDSLSRVYLRMHYKSECKGLYQDIYSDTFTVVRKPLIQNNQIASSQTIHRGDKVNPFVGQVASGGTADTYSYRWQINTQGNQENGWVNTDSLGLHYTAQVPTADCWYRRLVTSGACTQESNPLIIHLRSRAQLAPKDTAICSGKTALLRIDTAEFKTYYVEHSIDQIRWTKVEGSDQQNPAHINASGYYRVVATDQNNAFYSDTAYLSLWDLPNTTLHLQVLADSLCAHQSFDFVATANQDTGLAPVYIWNYLGKKQIGPNHFNISDLSLDHNQYTSHEVYAQLQSNHRCAELTDTITSNTLTVTLIPNDSLKVQLLQSADTICRYTDGSLYLQLKVQIQGGGDHPTYQWIRNGQAIPGATTDSLVLVDAQLKATDEIYCQVSSSAYCYAPGTGIVNSPKASLTLWDMFVDAGPDDEMLVGNPFITQGKVSGGSFLWHAIDGGTFEKADTLEAHFTPSEKEIENQYAQLVLTAATPSGCKASDTMTLTVLACEVMKLLPMSDDTLCIGDTLVLQAILYIPEGIKNVHPLHYQWTKAKTGEVLQSGADSTYSLITRKPSFEDYAVYLKTRNNCEYYDTLKVSTYGKPNVQTQNFAFYDQYGNSLYGEPCPLDKIQIRTRNVPSTWTYQWFDGTTNNYAWIQAPKDTLLKVNVIDQNTGCSASTQLQLLVSVVPSIYAGNDTAICLGNDYELPHTFTVLDPDANPTPQGFYRWVDAQGKVVGGGKGLAVGDPTRYVLSPTQTTFYTIQSRENADGYCWTLPDTIHVEVKSFKPQISYPDSVCMYTLGTRNPAYALSIEPGFTTYRWTTASGELISTNRTINVNLTSDSVFYASASNPNACIGRDTVKVALLEKPVFNFANTFACSGDNIEFEMKALRTRNTLLRYDWTFTSSSGQYGYIDQNPVKHQVPHSDLAGKNIQMQLSILDEDLMCHYVRDTSIQIVDMRIFPARGHEIVACQGSKVSLLDSLPHHINLGHITSWTSKPSTSYVNKAGSAFPQEDSYYYLQLNNPSFGCISRDTFHVKVDSLPKVHIQDSFRFCQSASIRVALQSYEHAINPHWYLKPDLTETYFVGVYEGTDAVDINVGDAQLTSAGFDLYVFVDGAGSCNSKSAVDTTHIVVSTPFLLSGLEHLTKPGNLCGNVSTFKLTLHPDTVKRFAYYYWRMQDSTEKIHSLSYERFSKNHKAAHYIDSLIFGDALGCEVRLPIMLDFASYPTLHPMKNGTSLPEVDTLYMCLGDSIHFSILEGAVNIDQANPQPRWYADKIETDKLGLANGTNDYILRPTKNTTYYASRMNPGLCERTDSVTLLLYPSFVPQAIADTNICQGASVSIKLRNDDP
ncbi:MAG: hypothetical protein RR190_00225, partial [Bacteroidales bacterium]